MLTVEENERLTRVGAGTPMGELMRRYWIPIRPYAQLLEEDVLPVRVLGEDLVLFRSTKGEMGLIGDRCPHRLTNLQLGIPDEGGLRCCYHGWMFSPTGQCVDMPLEAPESTFKDRIKIKGYPVREMGGLIWAYLGPEPAPLLPPWDLLVFPNAIRQIGVTDLNCNWLQCQENTGDPTHNVYLHGYLFKYVLEKQGKLDERAADEMMHTFYGRTKMAIGIESLYAHQTQYGMEKGINYSKALGADRDYSSRHSTVIFPFFTQTGGPDRIRQEFQIRVPVDDTHTYHINYGCFLAPEGVEVEEQDIIPWYQVPLYDEKGKPILDFVLAQDLHVWLSQGEVSDRTQEHLGRTDTPIILMRQQFVEQIRTVEDGGDPINVFRDPRRLPELLHGGVWPEDADLVSGRRRQFVSYRSAYHRGYSLDDADRYGPALPQIMDLMRRIEEFANARSDY